MENEWRSGDRVQEIGAVQMSGTVQATDGIYAVIAWDYGCVSRVIFHQVERWEAL